MNGSSEESPCRYTAFWAVWIFFFTMLIVHGAQVVSLFRQKSQLKASFQEVAKVLNSAQTVNNTWLAVSRDVVEMSNASAGARRIVQEFRLRPNSGGADAVPGRNSETVAEQQNPVPPSKPSEPPAGAKKK